MKKEVRSIDELQALAEGFLMGLSVAPSQGGATVVGLSGDLGAGKTAFVKCVATALGITDMVTSPTFILEKIYSISPDSLVGGRFKKLIHIDAYRLHGGDEMRALGWSTLVADEDNLVFLEWPEQVADALPSNMIQLSFEHVSEKVRRISGEYL